MTKKSIPFVRPPLDGRPKNQLLAALPAADLRRLRPKLSTIPIRVKQVFYTHGEPIRDVYFPNGRVVAITAALPNGTPVEVATVGDEGILGMEAFLSDDAVASGDTSMQVPDTDAEMLSVEDFPQLQKAGLIRYTHRRVTVRHRRGLEKASRECYAFIRAHFDRLRT